MGKRIMSILLALCLCITFLSACGGGSSGTTGAQTPATDSLQSGNSSNGLDESGDEASNNGETDEPNSLDSSFAGADVGVTVDSLGAYTIGIKSDGTVIVSGDKQFGRCKQEDVDGIPVETGRKPSYSCQWEVYRCILQRSLCHGGSLGGEQWYHRGNFWHDFLPGQHLHPWADYDIPISGRGLIIVVTRII